MRVKNFWYLAISLFSLCFLNSSCSSDDPDFHALQIDAKTMNSTSFGRGYFADQMKDSVYVLSTDSWTAKIDCDWMKFNETNSLVSSASFKYVYGESKVFSRCIAMSANTTGADRVALIRVDANKKTVSLPVCQFGYLNVTKPQRAVINSVPKGEEFTLSLPASKTSAELQFTLYAPASLQTSTPWIGLGEKNFETGDCTTTISLQPNTTGSERKGAVVLKSETGAQTTIVILQEK